MATSRIEYKGSLRCEATHLASGDAILTDAPTDNHGKGEAFSPTDLLATSLGLCMITVMGIGANERNIEIVKAEAEVTKNMAAAPRRVASIDLILHCRIKPDSPSNRKVLEEIGKKCPVAQSLKAELQQNITFKWEDDESPQV